MVFKVNNHDWKLKPVPANSELLKNSLGLYTLGVCDNNLKTIFIADNLPEHRFSKVLCHELVHTFSFENDCSYDIQTEEIIADFLSLFGRDIIYLADDIMSKILRRYA